MNATKQEMILLISCPVKRIWKICQSVPRCSINMIVNSHNLKTMLNAKLQKKYVRKVVKIIMNFTLKKEHKTINNINLILCK